MEGKIKALDRNLLIKATKTLLYLIPIIVITNRIYIKIYGDYKIDFSQFISFTETHMTNLAVAFLIFAIIFLFTYFLERYLMSLLILKSSKIKFELSDQEKTKINEKSKKVYGINVLKIGDEPFFKFEMIGDFAFIFIVPILWLIYLNNCIGYIIIVFLLGFFYYLMRMTIVIIESVNDSTSQDE